MSPSQASETCASASSATSAKNEIIASRMLSVNFALIPWFDRSEQESAFADGVATCKRDGCAPVETNLWPPRQPATFEIAPLRDSFLSQHFQSIQPRLTNGIAIGITKSVARADAARNKAAVPIAAESRSAPVPTSIPSVMAVHEHVAFPRLISSPSIQSAIARVVADWMDGDEINRGNATCS